MTTLRVVVRVVVVPEVPLGPPQPAPRVLQGPQVAELAARAARLELEVLRARRVQQALLAQQVPRAQHLVSMAERSTQGLTPPTHRERRAGRLTESIVPITVAKYEVAQRGGLDEAPTST